MLSYFVTFLWIRLIRKIISMVQKINKIEDIKTAEAFSLSWNHLPLCSIYSKDQIVEWFIPLRSSEVRKINVLELGCGNGSIMAHILDWLPEKIIGVDLGNSIKNAYEILKETNYNNWSLIKTDLTSYSNKSKFDLVYCIGVLHHLKSPKKGLDAVIRNVKPGGKFHCWVYAKEGNEVIRYFVDPLRRVICRFPWWVIKYALALPFSIPFFIYAKLLFKTKNFNICNKLPLFDYCIWIAKREFAFFRHVAFDQLISPQTTFIDKRTIEDWLSSYDEIDQNSVYILMRNGNSWKFGGRIV
jgi:ubiquinone/menaquinone biosynthesis C-methylase UbiE